jgi:2-amino-4-hydroxy-6-hydroxymethyldihydropteridine diphosphokinase
MSIVYLGLGSNLGNRARNIYGALRLLGSSVALGEVSRLYETEPVGLALQPWFLNLACRAKTDLQPLQLLVVAKGIERRMGRKEGVRFGPRVVDVDLLLYDHLVLETDELQIPHPRLHERGFVLIPLRELAPDLVHPLLGHTISDLADAWEGPETVRLYGEDSQWLSQ